MRNVDFAESKTGHNGGTLGSQENIDATILARMGKKQVLKVGVWNLMLPVGV